MRKILMTTALILPLGLTTAFAQETTTPTEPASPADTTQPAITSPEAATPDAPAAETTAPGTVPAETAPMTPAPETGAAPAVEDPAQQQSAEEQAQDALTAQMMDSDKVARQQAANELRIDWITGSNVLSPDGQSVGRINDLIVDGGNGQMIAAIIGVGGFLGVGEKQIAVPWEQLTVNYDASEITTDLTREEADAAPPYAFREREQAPAPQN